MREGAVCGGPFGPEPLSLALEEEVFGGWLLGESGFVGQWREIAFGLCYTQHGGSGLGLGWSEAHELGLEEALALLELLVERRKREAAELRRSGRRGARE
jgi:hypothetical protein